jgi:hypothetical protein
MSIANLEKKLRKSFAGQQAMLAELLKTPPILRGSFGRIHTRCGKPTCWCAQAGKGHVHARITWSQNGQLRTRKVPEEFLDKVRLLTASYRKFRRLQRHLMEQAALIKATLSDYEKARVAHTRTALPFLADAAPSMTQKSTNGRPKVRRMS